MIDELLLAEQLELLKPIVREIGLRGKVFSTDVDLVRNWFMNSCNKFGLQVTVIDMEFVCRQFWWHTLSSEMKQRLGGEVGTRQGPLPESLGVDTNAILDACMVVCSLKYMTEDKVVVRGATLFDEYIEELQLNPDVVEYPR